MTIRENITLAPIKVQGKSRDEANELADGLHKRLDLLEKADE